MDDYGDMGRGEQKAFDDSELSNGIVGIDTSKKPRSQVVSKAGKKDKKKKKSKSKPGKGSDSDDMGDEHSMKIQT